jgi:hypothetical protein
MRYRVLSILFIIVLFSSSSAVKADTVLISTTVSLGANGTWSGNAELERSGTILAEVGTTQGTIYFKVDQDNETVLSLVITPLEGLKTNDTLVKSGKISFSVNAVGNLFTADVSVTLTFVSASRISGSTTGIIVLLLLALPLITYYVYYYGKKKTIE